MLNPDRLPHRDPCPPYPRIVDDLPEQREVTARFGPLVCAESRVDETRVHSIGSHERANASAVNPRGVDRATEPPRLVMFWPSGPLSSTRGSQQILDRLIHPVADKLLVASFIFQPHLEVGLDRGL